MLSFHQGKNSGSFATAYIALQAGASFPFPPALVTDLQYTDTITADWLQLEPLPNSAKWTETQDTDESENPTWGYVVEMVINKDRQEITKLLADKVPFKLIMLVEDHNGESRLIGNEDQFCKLTYTQVKENGLVLQNLYRITITCTSQPHPAVYYLGD